MTHKIIQWRTSLAPQVIVIHNQRQKGRGKSHRQSVRESKDPASFASMDDLRDYLHSKEKSPITLSNIIHFLGQAGVGGQYKLPGSKSNSIDTDTSDDSSSSEDTSSSGRPQIKRQNQSPSSALDLITAIFLRVVAKGYKDFVYHVGAAIKHRLNSDSLDEEESKWPQVDPNKYRQLEPLMGGLLSIRSLRKAAYKYPLLLEMDPAELAVRLVSIKGLLKACDVALLVEQEPALYLGSGQEAVERQISKGLEQLKSGLAGADIYQIIQRDPCLIFIPELERGLLELRDLWDVDEQALADSDPQMLALAVRALSITGLPKGL